MKISPLFPRTLCFIFSLLSSHSALAALPVFLLTPLSPTNLQLAPNETALVQYQVSNLSLKPHALSMLPIPGVTQVTTGPGNCSDPLVLLGLSSCLLNLQINGSQIPSLISGGPILCPLGTNGLPNALECYRPNAANSLNIFAVPAPSQFIVTPSAGPNGAIEPDSPELVNSGGSIIFSALPEPGYIVDQWFVDGISNQSGGAFFTLANITANHNVAVNFINGGTLYAGGQDGNVYFSINGGVNWTAVNQPAGGNPITSVFATPSLVYAGSADGSVYASSDNGLNWSSIVTPAPTFAVNGLYVSTTNLYLASESGNLYICALDGTNCNPTTSPSPTMAINGVFAAANALYATSNDGFVYYSNNNGNNWTAINGQPDGSPAKSIYATATTLYVSTDNELIYTSNALTGGGNWTAFAQTTFSFYVNASGSLIYAANQAGYTYSLTYGTALGFVAYTALNSIFSLQ